MANNHLKRYLFDGRKSIELSQYPDDAWTWLTGEPDGEVSIKDYFKAVPWLYRGANLRADAVAAMPFGIYRGKDEIETSKDYKNMVGFLPHPRRLLRLIELSLILLGKSYLFNIHNRARTLELKYLNPTTITHEANADTGLTGFVRSLGTKRIELDIEDVVHFWLEDPYVEVGPPQTCPGKAALMASGVIANVDEFVAGFFKRGAIKAMLLTVQGAVDKDEAKKLKEWWNRFVSGVQNAFGAAVFNAEAVKPVVVGEGLKELEHQTLTQEKREDIATALGVPQTKLFSTSASGLGGGGVVEQDDVRFLADTIVPECEFIAEVLNVQVFQPMGLSIRFKPETLDAFQRDETARSAAFLNYVKAKMPPSVVAEMLGLELPESVTYTDLDAFWQERFEQTASMYGESQQQGVMERTREQEAKSMAELASWERFAIRRLGKNDDRPFVCYHVPDELQAQIRAGIQAATTEAEIKTTFASLTRDEQDGYRPLLEGLKLAVEALRVSA